MNNITISKKELTVLTNISDIVSRYTISRDLLSVYSTVCFANIENSDQTYYSICQQYLLVEDEIIKILEKALKSVYYPPHKIEKLYLTVMKWKLFRQSMVTSLSRLGRLQLSNPEFVDTIISPDELVYFNGLCDTYKNCINPKWHLKNTLSPMKTSITELSFYYTICDIIDSAL